MHGQKKFWNLILNPNGSFLSPKADNIEKFFEK